MFSVYVTLYATGEARTYKIGHNLTIAAAEERAALYSLRDCWIERE